MPALRVESLLDIKSELGLEVVAGKGGVHRRITGSRIQKPGLALTGYTAYVNPERLQVLGMTEISFLQSLSAAARENGVEQLCALQVSGIVITRGLGVPPELMAAGEQHQVAIFTSPLTSSLFITRAGKFLEERLSPTTSMHGVLIDVLGVGILLLGKSGIGKSEAALDLILRGHRLVADDIVEIRKSLPDAVYGSGSEIIKHHMEIRGLGIINIKDLFGISSVRDAKKIQLVVELVEWDENDEYDRLGVEENFHAILGVQVPMLRVPIRPGRNISSIIEVAARNLLLKFQGKHSALEFQDRLNRALMEAAPERGERVPVRVDEVE